MTDERREGANKAPANGEGIEWLERGWPLCEDGTCDTKRAYEQGIVAMSRGLAKLDRGQLDEIFPHRGASWDTFGPPADAGMWPSVFPGSLVLRVEKRVRKHIGHELILALFEKRVEQTGRPFVRSVWFILPRAWLSSPGMIGALCDQMLAHRGRRGHPRDTPPLTPPARPRAHHHLPYLREAQGELFTSDDATPSELMMALLDRARKSGSLDDTLLDRGLAVLCNPSTSYNFGLTIDPCSFRPPADWRPPIPFGDQRFASSQHPRSAERVDEQRVKSSPRSPRKRPSSLASSSARARSSPPANTPMHNHAFEKRVLRLIAGVISLQLLMLAVQLDAKLPQLQLRRSTPEHKAPDLRSDSGGERVATGEAADPPPRAVVAESAPERFVPIPRPNGLAALAIVEGPGLREARTLTPNETKLIELLAPDREKLIAVGISSEEDCSKRSRHALINAKFGAEILTRHGYEASWVVVRKPADPVAMLPPREAMTDGVMIMRDEDADSWRERSEDDCFVKEQQRGSGRGAS